MPRAKRTKPADAVVPTAETPDPVTPPAGPADPAEPLGREAAALQPMTAKELARPVDVAAREPGEDFVPRPDRSGRYPGREDLPAGDLLHTIDPTPERGLVGYHVDGGRLKGGASIQMTDYGAAVGVRFDVPGGKPSPEVLEPVKEDRTYKGGVKRGLTWDGRAREWGKRVADRAGVATRLEVEERTKDAAARYLESKGGGRTPF